MIRMIILVVLTGLLVSAGCKVEDISGIPFCKDIEGTGVDCIDKYTNMTYGGSNRDIQNAVCKEWKNYGTNHVMAFCFGEINTEYIRSMFNNTEWCS